MVAAVGAADGVGRLLGTHRETAFAALEVDGTHLAQFVPLVVAAAGTALRAGFVATLHVDAALHAVVVHHPHGAELLPLVGAVDAAVVRRRCLLGTYHDTALAALVVLQSRTHSGRQDEYCHNGSGYQDDSLFHNLQLFLQRYNFFSIRRVFFFSPYQKLSTVNSLGW